VAGLCFFCEAEVRAQVPTIRWKKEANLGEAALPTKTLTLQQFLARVASTHPLIQQAVLYKKLGQAQLQEARGGFDPKVGYTNQHKWLAGEKYYDINEFKTVVPLRAGLNAVGGYEYASGANAPNEYTLEKGIYFGGLELQLGRGLLIDNRRAGVLQGKNAVLLGDVFMRQYANKVLAEAAKDYWAFYYNYNEAAYLLEGVDLAQARLEGVTLKFKVGEEAAIDTVEAEILFQDRTNQYLEAWNEMRNARLRLQAYIWGPAQDLDPLDSLTIPEKFMLSDIPSVSPDITEGIARILESNPDLNARRIELKQLDIDRRLAREALRPMADIKYQFLGKEGSSTFIEEQAIFRNNYRFGVDLGIALFLRKERGKLAQVRIKTEQNRLALKQAERDAEIEYRQLRNDLTALRQQINTQERMVANYRVLRNGEAIKFSMGESSLFLVNTRESKLIEGEIKLVSLHNKWQKARIELLMLGGALIDGLQLATVK
jgi:outer membrane protein TolC